MKFRISEVQELIEVLSDSSFESVSVDEGDYVVHVRRAGLSGSSAAPLQVMPDSLTGVPVESSSASVEETQSVPMANEAVAGEPIRSQLVGRVSLCDDAGAFYVVEGQEVAAGHTVCTINSLKQVHPVTTPCAGVIVGLAVADGDIVEYGQILMTIGGVA